jgi:signal transduction histidine kinase
LGLAIVKHSVDLHQGRITIQSELNQGTLATVTLPRRITAPVPLKLPESGSVEA